MDSKSKIAIAAVFFLFVTFAQAQETKTPETVLVKLTPNESETGWMLLSVNFDKEEIKKIQDDRHVRLPAALSSEARIGLTRDINPVILILDKTKDGRTILVTADTNQNNDLTDDQTAQLVLDKDNEGGTTVINIERFRGTGRTQSITLPYFISYSIGKDRDGKQREHIGYGTHYRMEGTVDVGSLQHKVCLWDLTMDGKYNQSDLKQGSAIAVDLDDNGKFYGRNEYFVAGALIPLAGTYYEVDEIALDGSEIVFRRSELEPLKIGSPVPDLPLTDSLGKAFHLSDYRGRVVLLDFWASWCGFCLAAFPDVSEFAMKNAGKAFDVIGVNVDDAALLDKARQVVDKYDLSWREVMDGKGTVSPLYDRFGAKSDFGPSLPLYIVIDKEGFIRAGLPQFDEAKKVLEELLK
jgi:thiol-disulfide isomerase/thioredoxin